uniref:C2H2-type domain-containing protein n=1 Tax=Trichuris muris TaxID=70415 RepID=A0A5S6R294_TRIMR
MGRGVKRRSKPKRIVMATRSSKRNANHPREQKAASSNGRRKGTGGTSPRLRKNGVVKGNKSSTASAISPNSQTVTASRSITTRSSSRRASQLAAEKRLVRRGSVRHAHRRNGRFGEINSARLPSIDVGNLPTRCEWAGCNFVVTASSGSLLDHVQRHIADGTACLWVGCPAYNKPARKNRWLRDHVVDRHCETRLFHCPVGGCPLAFRLVDELEIHLSYSHCDEESDNANGSERAVSSPSVQEDGDAANGHERQRRRADNFVVQWSEFWKSIERIHRFRQLISEALGMPEEYKPILIGLYAKKEWDNFINGDYAGQKEKEFLADAVDLLLHSGLAIILEE